MSPEDTTSEAETADQPEAATETDANSVPIDPSTGEVLALITPDDPALATLRKTLHSVGYGIADALQFLSDFVGRPVNRLGELTPTEVVDCTAELLQILPGGTAATAAA